MFYKVKEYLMPFAIGAAILFVIGFIIFGVQSCFSTAFDHTYYADPDTQVFHKSGHRDDEYYYKPYDDYTDARKDGYIPCPYCLQESYREFSYSIDEIHALERDYDQLLDDYNDVYNFAAIFDRQLDLSAYFMGISRDELANKCADYDIEMLKEYSAEQNTDSDMSMTERIKQQFGKTE